MLPHKMKCREQRREKAGTSTFQMGRQWHAPNEITRNTCMSPSRSGMAGTRASALCRRHVHRNRDVTASVPQNEIPHRESQKKAENECSSTARNTRRVLQCSYNVTGNGTLPMARECRSPQPATMQNVRTRDRNEWQKIRQSMRQVECRYRSGRTRHQQRGTLHIKVSQVIASVSVEQCIRTQQNK